MSIFMLGLCQLLEAETSVRRRFLGSSQASKSLDRVRTLY